MDEKQKHEIARRVQPRAVLQALTAEAVEAIPSGQRIDDMVVITSFPFRIGRESRVREIRGNVERVERTRTGGGKPNNDLYLVDNSSKMNISREHAQIERRQDTYCLVDRGSACGIKCGGEAVGGNDKGGEIPIKDGDVFVLGTAMSPFLFRFIVLIDADIVE